jgi:hypothetical protein
MLGAYGACGQCWCRLGSPAHCCMGRWCVYISGTTKPVGRYRHNSSIAYAFLNEMHVLFFEKLSIFKVKKTVVLKIVFWLFVT